MCCRAVWCGAAQGLVLRPRVTLGGTEVGGAVGVLQTHIHLRLPWAGMQMCPLDFIPIHARRGWGQWGPRRLQGYLSQLGPCCSLPSDNSTEQCPGLVTPFPSWNRRPRKPTPASAPGCPGLCTPTSGSPHPTFPGRQHQNKRWGGREKGHGAWGFGEQEGGDPQEPWEGGGRGQNLSLERRALTLPLPPALAY